MNDDEPTLAQRLQKLMDARKPGGATTLPPPTAAPPAPGFRFGLGARVLELVGGERGTVRAAYYSATNRGPLYEIAINGGTIVARLENELELDLPLAPVSSAPR